MPVPFAACGTLGVPKQTWSDRALSGTAVCRAAPMVVTQCAEGLESICVSGVFGHWVRLSTAAMLQRVLSAFVVPYFEKVQRTNSVFRARRLIGQRSCPNGSRAYASGSR